MAVSHHPLAPFVRGAVSLLEEPDGLVIPQRFFREQQEHLVAIGRAHRASATAGVVVDLATNGTEVALDYRIVRRLDRSHPVYQAVMTGGVSGIAPYGLAEEGNVDGIDLMVGGRLLATVPVTGGTLRLAFENPEHEEVEVRIYLPTIMSVAIGNLRTNGSLKPLPQRGYLLALGDSITQGFVCGRPSFSYPMQVASTLGIDLVNQAVAGHVFDEDTLGGFSLWRDEPPEVVLIAYGTNDWSSKRSPGAIEGAAVAFLERVARLFPGIPTYVLSPLWRADEHEPVPCGRPLTWMHQMLTRVCSRHEQMHVVDGYHGIPKDPALFADGVLHPSAECMGLVADLLLEAMCNDSVDLLVSRRVARRLGEGQVGELVSQEARIDRNTSLRDGSPETHPEFDRLVRTIWRLRQPDGCPWDREQTQRSMAKHVVEEAYEAAEAMREADGVGAQAGVGGGAGARGGAGGGAGTPDARSEASAHLREELGDVLEQVLLSAQIADDADEFDIDDVCRELNRKLVRRHPHVFFARNGEGPAEEAGAAARGAAGNGTNGGPTGGGAATGSGPAGSGAATGASTGAANAPAADDEPIAATAEEVLRIWDDVKREERASGAAKKGLLDSVPVALPALMQAQKISKRAADAGFEWDTVADVWEQVAEERAEFEREEPGSAEAAMEFGDLLFALVNVARRSGIDAEEALAAANAKFRRRWAAMEAQADVDALDTAALNDLWNAVKEAE